MTFLTATPLPRRTLLRGRAEIDYAHIPRQTISPPAEARLVRLDLERRGRWVGYVTGAGDEELGLRGLRAGASGYLSKEVELEALPRALRGALDGEAAISIS